MELEQKPELEYWVSKSQSPNSILKYQLNILEKILVVPKNITNRIKDWKYRFY